MEIENGLLYVHLNSQRAVQLEAFAPIDNQELFVLTACLCLKTGFVFAQLSGCVGKGGVVCGRSVG